MTTKLVVPAGQAFTLSSGPSGASPETLAALGSPILYHYDPAFLETYAETLELLRRAFVTESKPVILHGEAVLGLEAGIASLIRSDDVVLNLVSGVYGSGTGWWLRRYTDRVIEVEVPYNTAVSAGMVEHALEENPDVTVVAAVHCETPSGTVNPIAEIGPVVDRHGALFFVDAVSSWGGMPVDLDQWKADFVVVGTQKCLGGPTALSLIHVSDEAWSHIGANEAAPKASMLSVLDWRDADGVVRPFPFTPSISDIYGLRACLEQYLREGAEAVQARHAVVAEATRAGVEALGLSLWAEDRSVCSNTVTAVAVPAGVDDAAVRKAARFDSGVMLSEGEGSLIGKVICIGHMGPSAYPMTPVLAVSGLGRALRSSGYKADIGAAVEAAVSVLDG
ncbi:MAG: alanine--glyoxylate aminotransferase family protein [Acidimicrobiales bacterium]